MERSEVKILIVEDDPTMGKALTEAVQKLGFHPVLIRKAADAVAQYKLHHFHALVIDCLLPGQSGLDLAVELRGQGANALPLILMSGIFKDKAYIKDAILKTGAYAFLTKPFNIQEFMQKLEEPLKDQVDSEQSPLLELMKKKSSAGERVKAIQSTDQVLGYELLQVLSYLMHSSIQGVLTLQPADSNESSEIHFHNNQMTRVTVKDPQSFFGALLVEKNFLSLEELNLALAKPSNKRIGERLVSENLISPHVIDLINAEQMSIRLSRIVNDTPYKIQFREQATEASDSFIDSKMFSRTIADLVTSKVSTDWLKKFYLVWLNYNLRTAPEYRLDHVVFTYPVFYRFPDLKQQVKENPPLQDLFNIYSGQEDDLCIAMHLLLLHGLVYFEKAVTINYQVQAQRLKKIELDMQHQDYFQILGVSQRARPNEIKKLYHELAKVFHPDKINPQAPQDIKDLAVRVFARMTTAYETLSNSDAKEKYVMQLQKGQAEKILQSEALLEDGKAQLKAHNHARANELFEAAAKLRPPTAELILHKLWARLAQIESHPDTAQLLQDVDMGLGKIPPEERHNATYYFVKGLFQRITGEMDAAKGNLSHAVALEPNFIEAKRELQLITLAKKDKPVDLLHGDLSDVMKALLKKKK